MRLSFAAVNVTGDTSADGPTPTQAAFSDCRAFKPSATDAVLFQYQAPFPAIVSGGDPGALPIAVALLRQGANSRPAAIVE